MTESVKRIRALCGRNIKEIVRDPLSLIFMLGMPLVMEIVFYFLFHSMTSQFAMKYLAPGIAVFALAFNTLFSGLLIAVDRGSSFLVRLFVSKTKPHEFILSYVFSLIPRAFAQSVLLFVVGGIIDSSIWSVGMVWGVLASMFVSLFFSGAGILLGSLCNEKSIGGVASVIIAGQSMLSGMWFPEEGIGGGMLTVMNILPFKNATMLVQNAMNGTGGDIVGGFVVPFLIVLAYTVAIFIAATLVFRSKMKSI